MTEIFGLRLSDEGLADLTAKIVSEPIPTGAGPRLLVTANVDHIVQLRKNVEFRAAYASAWTVTADGFPVYLYSQLRRAGVPARVTGADLFAHVMDQLDPTAHRVFFIAGTEATAEGLRKHLLKQNFPDDAVCACVPPFGFERDEEFSAVLARRIGQHETTHLFIGVGAPKSEMWCYQHRSSLGDCYVMSVGAGLDFFLGQKKRAPALIQRYGLEWFWRFVHEPRRLFYRYFIESWGFLVAIANDLLIARVRVSAPRRS